MKNNDLAMMVTVALVLLVVLIALAACATFVLAMLPAGT